MSPLISFRVNFMEKASTEIMIVVRVRVRERVSGGGIPNLKMLMILINLSSSS